MATAAAQAAALLGAIKANWLVGYTDIACTVTVAVDYLQTLPDEVQYLWGSPMSLGKVMFVLVRYYIFVHTAIAAWLHGDTSMTGNDQCIIPFIVESFSCILAQWLCDTVSYVRVYAFSGRKRGMLMFLVPWYLAIRVAEFVLAFKFVKTARFVTLPREARIGCISIGANTLLLSFLFKLILLNLLSVTVLMMWIAWSRRDVTNGPLGASGLVRIFFRDGVIYFICMSSFAIANIIVDHTAPQNGTQYIMVQIQVHANAILTGRMLLQLRSFSGRRETETGDSSLDSIHRNRRLTSSTYQAPTDVHFATYDSKIVPKSFTTVHTLNHASMSTQCA